MFIWIELYLKKLHWQQLNTRKFVENNQALPLEFERWKILEDETKAVNLNELWKDNPIFTEVLSICNLK